MARPPAIAILALMVTIGSAIPAAGQHLISLTLESSNVTGGESVTGTVTLNAPAPPHGITIGLSSSKPLVAQVPAVVTIPSGHDSRTFQIETKPVATNPNVMPPGIEAWIAARGPGRGLIRVTRRAKLTVLPPFVQAIGFVGPVHGGDPAFGLVVLTGRAPVGGTTVRLTSANTALATVPETITVNAGAQGALVTAATHGVNPAASVEISASRGPFNTKTATVQLLPAALEKIEISPSSVTGGTPAAGHVFLLGEVAAGSSIPVTLTSGSFVATPQPTTLTIAGGANQAPFTVNTTAVGSDTTASILGAYAGVTKQASVVVAPAGLASLTLTPGTVGGGAIPKGRVMLDGPAPSGGADVTLHRGYTNCPSQQVPTFPSLVKVLGNGPALFDVMTYALANSCEVRIQARYLGQCLEARLTVVPQVQSTGPAVVGVACPSAAIASPARSPRPSRTTRPVRR